MYSLFKLETFGGKPQAFTLGEGSEVEMNKLYSTMKKRYAKRNEKAVMVVRLTDSAVSVSRFN